MRWGGVRGWGVGGGGGGGAGVGRGGGGVGQSPAPFHVLCVTYSTTLDSYSTTLDSLSLFLCETTGIFTFSLEVHPEGSEGIVRRSKLHLVDLAGSERIYK